MSDRASTPLLRVDNLHTSFDIEGQKAHAVNGVSFHIDGNEVLGLVGESGCGKSVTSLSLLKLVPDPPGKIESGEVWFKGRDLLKLSYDELHKVRGKEISMIFQEPMTSLNPVFTIGWQLREAVRFHTSASKKEADDRAVEMLEKVGIPDARKRLKDYPHQFSGGMRQRVMIAMALSLDPALLIADEPTTALDVTIQAQILDLMLDLKERTHASILLITHDLAVVAETCQRVVVMYAGKIQEVAAVRTLFGDARHPYTRGLLSSLPRPEVSRVKRLTTIPGIIPSLLDLPQGCKFCTRCPARQERLDRGDKEFVRRCDEVEPELVEAQPGHWVRCHLTEESS